MSATVNTEVRYLNPEWKYRKDIPSIGDRASRRANTSKHPVSINDARGMPLDLDDCGFVVTELASTVQDFHDESEVRSTYYAEIHDVMRDLTGADEVFFTPEHVVRTEDTSDFNRAYARFVHCDYSLSDTPKDREKALAKHRDVLDPAKHWEFAWYNIWQPIEREVQQNPLAVVDARSLDVDDIVDYYYTGYGKKGLTSMPVFNPNHRFFYFPLMQTNEMLVFKQLDTRSGNAMACPHTSFNLEAPENALGRRSIEVRVTCAFGSN